MTDKGDSEWNYAFALGILEDAVHHLRDIKISIAQGTRSSIYSILYYVEGCFFIEIALKTLANMDPSSGSYPRKHVGVKLWHAIRGQSRHDIEHRWVPIDGAEFGDMMKDLDGLYTEARYSGFSGKKVRNLRGGPDIIITILEICNAVIRKRMSEITVGDDEAAGSDITPEW